MKDLGNAAIPHAQSILQKRGESHFKTGQALVDIGTDQAFELIVEALNGRTQMKPANAAAFLGAFIERDLIPLGRARALPALVDGMVHCLEQCPKRRSIRLAKKLKLRECIPSLRRLATHENYEIRREAENAILEISGERVSLGGFIERFERQEIVPNLLRRSAERSLDDVSVWEAKLGRSHSGEPQVVLTSHSKGDRSTRILVVDLALRTIIERTVPFVIKGFVLVSATPERDQPWMVGLGTPYRYDPTSFAFALDSGGRELWRSTVSSKRISSITLQYDQRGIPERSILVCSGGLRSGLVALEFDGDQHWLAPAQSFAYAHSNSCVPDRLLGSGGGMGTAQLLDARGTPKARTRASEQHPTISTAALIPRSDGSFVVAAARRAVADKAPQLALYDESLLEIGVYPLSHRAKFLVGVSGACDLDSVILCATDENTLMVIDSEGVLRWRGSAFKGSCAPDAIRGLDVLSDQRNRRAWVLLYTSSLLSIWNYAPGCVSSTDEPSGR